MSSFEQRKWTDMSTAEVEGHALRPKVRRSNLCILCDKPIIAIDPTVDWVIKDGAHRTCAEQITGPLP